MSGGEEDGLLEEGLGISISSIVCMSSVSLTSWGGFMEFEWQAEYRRLDGVCVNCTWMR